jgi:hypothetical protein
MSKVGRVAIRFALIGILITVAMYASIPYVPYIEKPNLIEGILGLMSVVLCPAGLLAVPLFDIKPYSPPGVVLWSFIALLNMGLYAVVGEVVGKLLSRRAD